MEAFHVIVFNARIKQQIEQNKSNFNLLIFAVPCLPEKKNAI